MGRDGLAHTCTCTFTHMHTHDTWRQGWSWGSGDKQEASPSTTTASLSPPSSSLPSPPPSPAWTGPGFGAGGRGRDLQGPSGLSDEGTPAGETGQPLRSQSPPPSPCPQGLRGLGLLLHPREGPKCPHFFRSDTDCATSSYIWASWSQVKMT